MNLAGLLSELRSQRDLLNQAQSCVASQNGTAGSSFRSQMQAPALRNRSRELTLGGFGAEKGDSC
jgi:hypothetical protein